MAKSTLEQVREKLFSTKQPSEKMNEEIKNKVEKIKEQKLKKLKPSLFANKTDEISEKDYQKISTLADFVAEYVKKVGPKQAILDFQVGINLLNGYKKDSLISSKMQLEEDSDFGEKTFEALFDVLKNYSIDVIKQYIKLGAANNTIWSTKNNKQIDTDKKISEITQQLNERIN